MTQASLTGALRAVTPDLFDRLHQEITAERVYRYLKPLADTPAPSQTARFTRAPVLAALLAEDGVLSKPNVSFTRDFAGTGNSALLVGREPHAKAVWMLAHLDIISYMLEPPRGGRYPLSPLCYHMMHPGRRAAEVVEYDLTAHRYVTVCRGDIVTEDKNAVFFEPAPDAAPLCPGQRVCFSSTLEWNRATGEVRGSLDDAAAAVALVLAAAAVSDYPGVELLLGLTDEEEGIEGGANQTICRGGARLLHHFAQPELVIDSDIHESIEMLEGGGPQGFRPGDGASLAERTSRGRGSVTPPHLFALLRRFAYELADEGIAVRENWGGYVSRSEGVNAMVRTPNVCILGFLGANRHFERDVTSAHMDDLVNLARAAACLTLLTRTPVWQEVMHP
jgi:hypothetical protein